MKSYQKLIINAKYCIFQEETPDSPKHHIKYIEILDYKLWSDCLEIMFPHRKVSKNTYFRHKGVLQSKKTWTFVPVPSIKIPHPEGMTLYKFLQKKNGKAEEISSKPVEQLSLL